MSLHRPRICHIRCIRSFAVTTSAADDVVCRGTWALLNRCYVERSISSTGVVAPKGWRKLHALLNPLSGYLRTPIRFIHRSEPRTQNPSAPSSSSSRSNPAQFGNQVGKSSTWHSGLQPRRVARTRLRSSSLTSTLAHDKPQQAIAAASKAATSDAGASPRAPPHLSSLPLSSEAGRTRTPLRSAVYSPTAQALKSSSGNRKERFPHEASATKRRVTPRRHLKKMSQGVPRLSLPGGYPLKAVGISAVAADTGAEQRVAEMLKRDYEQTSPGSRDYHPPLPEMISIPHTVLKRCVLSLTLPARVSTAEDQHDSKVEVYAIGQAVKSKLARTLCFMHAEQLLDYYTSIAPTASEGSEHHAGLQGPPLPLEEKTLCWEGEVPEEEDFSCWNAYVMACEKYVENKSDRLLHEAYQREEVPASHDHPVANRARDLMRRHRKRYCRPSVLSELNENLRDGSSLIRTAHLKDVFVATLVLDPVMKLTASAVARSSKEAKRECAAHALCILRVLKEDAQGHDESNLAPKEQQSSRKATKQRAEGIDKSAHQPAASLPSLLQNLRSEQHKLLTYYQLLFGEASLAMQTTFTKEPGVVKKDTIYRCHLTIMGLSCEATGVNRYEAQRAALESAVTDLLLYDERLQAIESFALAYPSISPESIPSAALPEKVIMELQTKLQPLVQHQAATVVEANKSSAQEDASATAEDPLCDNDHIIAEDVTQASTVDQSSLRVQDAHHLTEDPAYAAQMMHDLITLHQNPVYLSQFHPRRSTLAMASVRMQLLEAIAHHRVTVVCGTTGCGKTTQVPQYILDNEITQGRGDRCNVLVTQPRRLSSFSVAERIAQERLSAVGGDVGYSVRLDARPGRHITVCTTGVLLQIFTTHPDLEHVSHLIIDEVHERDINCDVVLALVKGLLARNAHLRIILMSATMQADVFSRYFGADTPVVQVDGSVYPVTVHYLESIASDAGSVNFYSPMFDAVQPPQQSTSAETAEVAPTAWKGRRASVRQPAKVDYNLIAYLVHRSVEVDLAHQMEGKAVLVFLPGWKELIAAKSIIESYTGPFAPVGGAQRCHIILLHSTIESSKQRECFRPAPPGTVKVVLATNIAESGITIDDVAVVIDTGLIKTTTWASRPSSSTAAAAASCSSSVYVPLSDSAVDSSTSPKSIGKDRVSTPVFSTQLKLGYASQANATQRKGRAGRTQGGVCYRLFTREIWDSMPAFPEADIHRVPLTQVLLKLLSLGHVRPKDTMETFIEPPSSTNVEASMELLRGIGAVGENGRLSPLGAYLALLPCDPRIGKMIIIGTVLRCLDSVLTVAACTDVSPYISHRDAAREARAKRYLFSRGSQSDHISFLNAYNAYCASGESEEFALHNSLRSGNMHIISKYKAQYREILRQSGLIGDDEECKTTATVYASSAQDKCDEFLLGRTMASEFVEAKEVDDRSGASSSCSLVPVHPSDQLNSCKVAAPTYKGKLCVDTSSLSLHSFDVALVKACVCAALFPNVAALRPPSRALPTWRIKQAACKVELQTKHFRLIKPAKDSVCRRVGGPHSQKVPNRDELVQQLRTTAHSQRPGAANASSPPPTPALFYVFQDVFGVKEMRQDFLTSLSAVSLWALLLFGASESTLRFYTSLSLCVVDGWIAVHIQPTTYKLISDVRQALYECLRRKYHNPHDPQNNAALLTVMEVCRAVLKAPVLDIHHLAEFETKADDGEGGGDTRPLSSSAADTPSSWQLVDIGCIVDPLVHQRQVPLSADSTEWAAKVDGFLRAEEDDNGDDDEEEAEAPCDAARVKEAESQEQADGDTVEDWEL